MKYPDTLFLTPASWGEQSLVAEREARRIVADLRRNAGPDFGDITLAECDVLYRTDDHAEEEDVARPIYKQHGDGRFVVRHEFGREYNLRRVDGRGGWLICADGRRPKNSACE